MKDEYDVLVLGGGTAGENAALYATQYSGLKAAVVESALVGGACSYWACMPSKALLRPVAATRAANALPGVVADLADVAAVLRHRDEIVHHRSDDSQVLWASSAGIDVIRGHGRLVGVKRLAVTDQSSTRTIRARHAIVLATGSAGFIPDIRGLAEAEPWTSDEATSMSVVPGSIIILGGGVVGCEAATWFNGLGSDVTLVESGPRILPRVEPHAAALVHGALVEAGVDVRLGVGTKEVKRRQEVEVDLTNGEVLWADELMVAAGRVPQRDDAGLRELRLGEPWRVDDAMRLEGATDWLYAVGDVNGGSTMLTHMGKHQGRVAGEDIARRFGSRRLDDPWSPGRPAREPVVPQVVFTDPEVAAVGQTLTVAQRANPGVIAIEYDTGKVAGAWLLDPAFVGWAQLVVDAPSRRLLGATFVGPGSAELLFAATLAITSGIDLRHLWNVVPSYPTVSEVWLRLLETARSHL